MDTAIIQYIPILRYFSGNFNCANDLMRQMNLSWKADEIVSEAKVVSVELEEYIKTGSLPTAPGQFTSLLWHQIYFFNKQF